jgi:hypothetical protein
MAESPRLSKRQTAQPNRRSKACGDIPPNTETELYECVPAGALLGGFSDYDGEGPDS